MSSSISCKIYKIELIYTRELDIIEKHCNKRDPLHRMCGWIKFVVRHNYFWSLSVNKSVESFTCHFDN